MDLKEAVETVREYKEMVKGCGHPFSGPIILDALERTARRFEEMLRCEQHMNLGQSTNDIGWLEVLRSAGVVGSKWMMESDLRDGEREIVLRKNGKVVAGFDDPADAERVLALLRADEKA